MSMLSQCSISVCVFSGEIITKHFTTLRPTRLVYFAESYCNIQFQLLVSCMIPIFRRKPSS